MDPTGQEEILHLTKAIAYRRGRNVAKMTSELMTLEVVEIPTGYRDP